MSTGGRSRGVFLLAGVLLRVVLSTETAASTAVSTMRTLEERSISACQAAFDDAVDVQSRGGVVNVDSIVGVYSTGCCVGVSHAAALTF